MPLNLQTNRGSFAIDPDQLAGLKPAKARSEEGHIVEATEVLISIGVLPVPVHVAMKHMAEELERASKPSRIVLPTGPVPRG